MRAGWRLSMTNMTPEESPQQRLWNQVNQAFAPFAETRVYAIRADTFFHLALRERNPALFHLKNLSYPVAAFWRSQGFNEPPRSEAEFMFVCDYRAEAGWGTLRPLLGASEFPLSVVVNAKVLAACRNEMALPKTPAVQVRCADFIPRAWIRWPELWKQSRADYLALLSAAPAALLRPLQAARLVIRALLARARAYERFYEECFSSQPPRAVVTHNDFTSLSYLAGLIARRHGVPDFTLQHGFPSLEYFPTSASHYLVWGPAFRDAMQRHSTHARTEFEAVGAPRLDCLVHKADQRQAARKRLHACGLIDAGKLNAVFLSQGQSPVFSAAEHARILSLVCALSREPWLNLRVRLHPQELEREWRRWGLAPAAVLSREISLAECLLAADVVLSVNSTAMLEAALLETPVVQMALPGLEDRLGLLRFPAQVQDLASAAALLQRLRHPAQREASVSAQRGLVQRCVTEPGHGTERVWQYIRAHCRSDLHPALAVAAASS